MAQQRDLAFCRNVDMPAEPFQLLFRLLHKKIRSRRVDWNLQSLLLCMRTQCLRILHRCAAVRCFVIQHQLYPLAAIFLCLVDGIKACKFPVLIQPFKAVSTDTTLHVPLLFGCCVKCLPLPIYQIREWAQGIFFTKKLSVFYQKRTILSFFSALQTSGLTIHIFYYNVVNLAEGCAVFQHFPGLIGMEMDFDHRRRPPAGSLP